MPLEEQEVSRIRWAGVALGAATTGVLAGTLLAFISLVLEPYLGTIIGTAPADGGTSVTVTEERVHGLLVGTSVVLAVLLAFFVGGLVAGRFAPLRAGLNGAVMGALIVVVPLAGLLVGIVTSALEPIENPGDVSARSENLRMLVAALVVCSGISPVFVLAGFLGGRIGRRPGGSPFREAGQGS